MLIFYRPWNNPQLWCDIAWKHDNSTNISRIGPKLIPWMHPRSVLVKFEDGWPWPILRSPGDRFQHENLQFSLENTITQQLVALGPNLYHGCILVCVPWFSLKMDDLDLFFKVMGVDFNIFISPNEVFGDIMVLASSPPRPPVDPDNVNALTRKIFNVSLSNFRWG